MGRDITEIKMALADIAFANQELRDTQSQLVQSEKMASLGSLVAGIAHEINTPVGAIGSMHDTLVRAVNKLKKNLEEKAPELLENDRRIKSTFELIGSANEVINTGCERVTEIVRRLRSFARLDEAELKKVDIHEGLEDTLILVHHEIKHNITVERDYGEIPRISVYPGRLNQVFLNILNNARQAIEGKGTVTIKTYMAEGKVHVAISDTGAGISPEDIKNVFDPGFTTKGVGVGTGLGLSICYQIIQEHKGEIKVESERGKGTTFVVTLPMNLDEILGSRDSLPLYFFNNSSKILSASTSVNIPTSSAPLTTGRLLIFLSTSKCTASSTSVSSRTVNGSRVMIFDTWVESSTSL